ncbi:MAG: insulinase family protein [Phycisphaerales bacterium]|nr:insulinase family protein [Phycisphaerae bacterium]NNF43807.1 insulinase family protein [Phycisphaerales bacterium]NNM27207.1 insulinase family protein [Phycisphaerales bacterium]
MSVIITHRLPSGATLLIEPISGVRSAAVNWRVPAGAATDPADRQGQATMLSELIFRGAGGLDSRSHSDALDRLGVQRAADPLAHHIQIEATMLGSRLDDAAGLIASLVCGPTLDDAEVAPVRSLCLQSLQGLEDDPQHLAMLRLREQHLPPPLDRHGYGDAGVLESITGAELREAWKHRFVPPGSIIAAAGAVDADRWIQTLERELAGWQGAAPSPLSFGDPRRGSRHIEQDTSQVHIGLAYDAPPESDPNAMLERAATAVLSGSSSGRLFTEVRQKRSLCYSVGASYRSGREGGWVALYAGTTPERAQETLDVCGQEIERLREGVTAEEFERAIVGMKSHLIMHGESTPARAAALANDQFRLGRPRSLADVAAEIDALTRSDLNAYLADRGFGPFTVVSIGPTPLEAPVASAEAGAA